MNGGASVAAADEADAAADVFRRLTERPADLLRFATAGSVDDGKSTLIGRLLYDSKQVLIDQLAHVEQTSQRTRPRLPRPLAADRRPARRARAGDHDRRRLPLLRDRPAALHHRRHAGPRAVHAQHGHGRLDGGSRDRAGRRAQGRRRPVQAPRLHQLAARHPARRRVRQQDGPRRLRRGRLRHDRRGVRPLRRAPGDARRDVHPDLGAARRQRRRALGGDALVPGPAAALPPRARPHRLRPQPDRRPLPGAVGDPPAGRGLPRLRGPGGRRDDAPRRRGRRAARRAALDGGRDRHLRRAGRGGLPADVGGGPPARRHRRLARHDARAHAQPADGLQPLRGAGVLDVRAAAAARAALLRQAHDPHRDGRQRGRALPDRRRDAAPRRTGRRRWS